MKLEIFEGKAKDDEPVRIKGFQESDGIRYAVVNNNGCPIDRGNLFIPKNDGTLGLYGGIDPDFGFQLDGKGCIKIVVE